MSKMSGATKTEKKDKQRRQVYFRAGSAEKTAEARRPSHTVGEQVTVEGTVYVVTRVQPLEYSKGADAVILLPAKPVKTASKAGKK